MSAGRVPPDIEIELLVDQEIAKGCALPRWGWPTPGPYNGATGALRIAGWQKVRIATQRGLLGWPRTCSVCRATTGLHRHAELYGRPMLAKPICRSCHFYVHRRFNRPDEWTTFLARHEKVGWISRLRLGELTVAEGRALEAQIDPLGLAGE